MRLHTNIQIIGWGTVPAEDRFNFTNAQVLELVQQNRQDAGLDPLDLTPDGVTAKLGMKNRQYIARVDPSLGSTELALRAAERAFAQALKTDSGFHPEKVHLIVSGSSTPDDLYPGCAPKLQAALGIPDAEAFDVSLACCSGTQALIEAVRAMQLGYNPYAVVAIGETIGSRANDLMDENSFIWGDGGGAVVLRADASGNPNFGFLGFRSRSDGSLSGTTRSRGIGAHPDHRRFPAPNASMEGRGTEIYRWVVGPIAESLKQFLAENRITVNDRTFLLPHNGNLRMVEKVGAAIGLPPDQILHQIAERGNQSSASVLATLAEYADQGFFRHEDQLILATFGGGVAYNFVLYRWRDSDRR